MHSRRNTYKEFVKFRERSNPCIAGLSKYLEEPKRHQDSCRICFMEYADNGTPDIQDSITPFESVTPRHFPSILNPPTAGHGRLIIIEDIHPLVAEELGSTLDVDPVFFADHILTKYNDVSVSLAPPSVALAPSQLLSEESSFHIHTQQIVDLSHAGSFRNLPFTTGNVPRAVRHLPALSGQYLGILRACCSILTKKFDRSWIGIILIDPTLTSVIVNQQSRNFQPELVRKGFEDFREPIPFSTFCSPKFSSGSQNHSNSLLDMLKEYFSSRPVTVKDNRPSILELAYCPLRVAIGEWGSYTQLMGHILAYHEYSLRGIDKTSFSDKGDIVDLQKWRHRAIQSQLKIESTKQYVQHWSAQENDKEVSWELLVKDLDHFSKSIEQYGQSLERIIPVLTSVVQLRDSRQSIAASIDVKRLTYVALVFIPLSWVAAIFSMSDDFAPGQTKFWVYFAVSIPFCIAVVGFSFLVNLIVKKHA